MLPVEQPFKTYTGLDGKPLNNGSVYFGEPDQDPITHPVTVYWDAAGTLPASQPLPTVNGYIVNDSGSAANVFCSGAYSETVIDSKDRQVFYAPTSDDFSIAGALNKPSGSTMIGFTQAGTDAVERTLQDELRETLKLTQFFILGEASVDAAFTRALAAFSRPGTLIIPQGFYNLQGKIQIRTDIPLKIRGAGMNSTLIFCSSAISLDTMFEQVGSVADTFEMSDLTLVGNGKAQCGFRSENIIASLFRNVAITGTTVGALRTNNGYSNTFENIKLYSNTGGGLQCTGLNNNNINIRNAQIYANDGIGLELGNGYSVTVAGCDIETNGVAGLIAYDIKSLTIRDSYVERNGATGYAYTTVDGSPENLTVHSDMHLLSGGKTIGGLRSTAVTQCTINNVQFTPYGTGNVPSAGLSIDSPIFATVVDGLSVTNCEVLDPTKIKQMVSLYNNNTRSAAYQCVIDGNTVNTFGFLGTGNTSFSFNTAHNIDTPLAQSPHNYASQDLSSYAQLSGSTGSFRRSANNYQGYPVYAIAAGDFQYGYDIDLTANPELKGKVVWFGVWYNVADNGSTVQLTIGGNSDSDGSVFDSAMAGGVYAFKSVSKKVLASDTSLFISLKRIGAGTGPILICNPIVSIGGFGANRYPIPNIPPVWRAGAAPTTGTWNVGDRVVNVTPTVGQPKAWVCTAAGTPGTWVSEGNL
jgi:hypothetical protein